MKKLTALIFVLPLLSIYGQNVIACYYERLSPVDICLDKHDLESEEFKACVCNSRDMDRYEYEKQYNICKGIIGPINFLPSRKPEIMEIILNIQKECDKKSKKTIR